MFHVKGLRNKNKNLHSETTVRDRQPRRLVGSNLDLLMCGVCMRGRGEYRGAVGTEALRQGCRYSRLLRIFTVPSRLKFGKKKAVYESGGTFHDPDLAGNCRGCHLTLNMKTRLFFFWFLFLDSVRTPESEESRQQILRHRATK